MVAFAACSLGKEKIGELVPHEDKQEAQEMLAVVAEALEELLRMGRFPTVESRTFVRR